MNPLAATFGGPASFGPLGNAGPSSAEIGGNIRFSTGAFGPTNGIDWKLAGIIGLFSIIGIITWAKSSK